MKDETLLPDVDSLEKVLEWIAGLPVPTKSATANYCRLKNFITDYRVAIQSGNSGQVHDGWRGEAERQAEIYGQSFVVFRNGEEPQCADPTKVVISFTDKGLGHDTKGDGWIPVSERMPGESGRYWCYVEEQNSLGKSHYQWNCSWNGDAWSDPALSGRVTHWQPMPDSPKGV